MIWIIAITPMCAGNGAVAIIALKSSRWEYQLWADNVSSFLLAGLKPDFVHEMESGRNGNSIRFTG